MEKFGFNIRHYQDIEGGKVNFTLETLYRLAGVFKVTPHSLVKESPSIYPRINKRTYWL